MLNKKTPFFNLVILTLCVGYSTPSLAIRYPGRCAVALAGLVAPAAWALGLTRYVTPEHRAQTVIAEDHLSMIDQRLRERGHPAIKTELRNAIVNLNSNDPTWNARLFFARAGALLATLRQVAAEAGLSVDELSGNIVVVRSSAHHSSIQLDLRQLLFSRNIRQFAFTSDPNDHHPDRNQPGFRRFLPPSVIVEGFPQGAIEANRMGALRYRMQATPEDQPNTYIRDEAAVAVFQLAEFIATRGRSQVGDILIGSPPGEGFSSPHSER